MPIRDLANPTRFLAFSGRLLPWLWAASAVGLAVGLYLGLYVAPADFKQGDMVRIMFIHVPFAWLSMACYGVMAIAALGTLVWRHPLADVLQKSAAPIGAAFTFLALVTGSLWGKPTWGTYWVWDARLTSVLILFIIYLGLIALWQAVEDPGKAARAAAILAGGAADGGAVRGAGFFSASGSSSSSSTSSVTVIVTRDRASGSPSVSMRPRTATCASAVSKPSAGSVTTTWRKSGQWARVSRSSARRSGDVSSTRTLQSCRMNATCSGLSKGLTGTKTPPAAGAPKLAITVSKRFSR